MLSLQGLAPCLRSTHGPLFSEGPQVGAVDALALGRYIPLVPPGKTKLWVELIPPKG